MKLVCALFLATSAFAGTIASYDPQTQQFTQSTSVTSQLDEQGNPVPACCQETGVSQHTFFITITGLDQLYPPGSPTPFTLTIPVDQIYGNIGSDAGGTACLDHIICNTSGYLAHFIVDASNSHPFVWTFELETEAEATPHLTQLFCGPSQQTFCYYNTSWTTTEIVDFGNIRLLDSQQVQDFTSRVSISVTSLPEPGALVLTGIGLTAVGWMKLRAAPTQILAFYREAKAGASVE